MSAFHTTFVSHAHADNALCDRYIVALRARGIDIWYDRDNAQNGHLLGSAIQDELKTRSAFVLLMTEASLNSFWVDLETQTFLGLLAQQRSRLLLPVRISSCTVPPMLNAFFWIDALAMPFEQAIDAIAAALTTSAAPPSTIPPIPQPREILPPLGPAPAPANSAPAHHLTPMPLYNLGFRGYTIGGVECILPPICPVPGGVFTMGSDKSRDKRAYDFETPQYPVEVDAFAIGQYPVTVAEYACAVQAKVVREPPQYESGGKNYGPDWMMQQTHPDHPVVCVSCNDADAYIRWLEKTTGQPWRLPSEAEWEKAARGTDGRIYPWGDSFDKARCNTSEGGIGTTAPVGRYPSGASPYHAQDMAGNVLEWTSSPHQLYPFCKNNGRENPNNTETRMMRGGSWSHGTVGVRAAHRIYNTPDSFAQTVGFRLLLVAGSV
ncbi:MAG TPA: SUMF1/EgtB/PvdO family nonheme iron enzyme [Ktedonobacterales bacterium]|jgi:formylglycine-generating enzyme required for sulfatase activity